MPTTTMRRIRVVWSGIAGTPFLQTLFFDATTGTAQENVDELASSLQGANTLFPTELRWTIQDDIEIVDPVSGQTVDLVTAAGSTQTGSSTAELLSLGTQGLLWLRTGVWIGGREVRGKFFWPGATENANDDGQPTSAYTTAMQANAQALIGQATVNLVVYSRAHRVWHPIVATVGSQYFARLTTRQR